MKVFNTIHSLYFRFHIETIDKFRPNFSENIIESPIRAHN